MTNLLGRKLGKYEVVERIASGGMAEVYKAFQPSIERFVAIKVMHGHLAQADDFVQRFQREARSVGRLLHPNILGLIDFDVDGEMYYMVMEYIPGGTLRSYLNTQQRLPIEEALRITAQLADALSYAHQQGMIHRDIKPGNVMFADETYQHVVLTDFGIARLLDDAEARLTLPGAVFGTPSYMSPEALRGEPVDARSDLYSLGVMLYEMVTGQRPYVAETPYSLLMKLTKEPLTPPRKLNPALPEALQKLILKVLEKEPTKRFQSAAEFGAAIKQLQDDLLVRSSRGTFPFQRQATTKRRPPTPVVAPKLPTPPPAVLQATVAEEAPVRRIKWLRMVQVALVLVIMVGLAVFAFLNRAYLQWPTSVTDVTALPTSAKITTIAAAPATPTATALPATPTTVPPTVTSTPSPTPSPTLLPSPTSTVPPQPAAVATGATLAAATTIAVLPPPLGVLRLSPGKDDHTFRLALGPVKLPPAGAHYELWLRHDNAPPLNLGLLPVEQGEISVTGSHQENLLADYTQAVITLERDDDPATMASTVLFASQWPTGFATALRQLLVDNGVNQQGFLTGAATQSQLAFAQSAALQAALAKADLAAAQREAEGILNILEGAQSAVAGDKNKDGQPYDPGDGFGIRPYLAATHEQLLLVSQITATAELAINTHYAVDLVQALQPVAETAAVQARQLVTATSVAAAQPLADELQRLLAGLFKGVDQDGNGLIEPAYGEGGIQAAETLVRALAQYPFGDKALALGGAAADTITLSAAAPAVVGTLWFSEEAVTTPITTTATQSPPLRFTLSLATLAQPPVGYHYELWLAGDENAAALQLARVPVHDGSVRLVGQLAQNPFADAPGLLLALTADDATAQTVGVPVYRSEAPRDELRGVLHQLLGPAEGNEQGLLLAMRAQVWQAHAQVTLMQEALDADNVEQVRSYAEYIVHTLAGKAGYGDLDGDGKSPPLANPVSVREYLQQARKQTVQLSPLVTASPRTRFYTARALATYDHSLDLVEQATNKVIQIFAADTIADVRPFVDELAQLLTLALYGDDRDGNGIIDPLADEGAVLALFTLVAQVGEYPIYRLEPSAQVK